MAMGNGRLIEVRLKVVVQALVDGVPLKQDRVPPFEPSRLLQLLGKGVVVKFPSTGEKRKYAMPYADDVRRLVREERDNAATSCVQDNSDQDKAILRARINACNRVLEMLQQARR